VGRGELQVEEGVTKYMGINGWDEMYRSKKWDILRKVRQVAFFKKEIKKKTCLNYSASNKDNLI
jgi:hypothetical protein